MTNSKTTEAHIKLAIFIVQALHLV